MQSLFAQSKTGTRRSWIFWTLVLSPVVLIVVLSVFVGRVRAFTAIATREVLVFRQRIVDEQYDAIYNSASSALRSHVSEESFTKRLATIRSKMGECRPSQPRTSFVNANTTATSVRQQYVTSCANGTLQETFLYLIANNEAQLARYDASSEFK
jgi:hypothetical protein